MIKIRHAAFPQDESAVLAIWREYVASPSVSLDYQGYEEEFACLPGKYSAPGGCLLVGTIDTVIVSCAGFRKVSSEICEIKRLYVRPQARGHRLGRMLVERLVREARASGYTEIRLDVLAEFEAARKLYAEIGFQPAEAVSQNPVPGTAFLGLRIA